MSWWRDGKDYGVFFNRDEKKTRPRAEPPALRDDSFLAPIDPAGGGTWISANRDGLIIALLNRWHEQQSGDKSRGLLVWDIARLRHTAELQTALAELDLSRFHPFTLVAIDATTERQWDWNGATLSEKRATSPVSSSSYKTAEVISRRTQSYHSLLKAAPAPAQLESFHSMSGEGAFSPRMLRDDAQTWSRSEIRVEQENVRWSYLEEFLDFSLPPHEWLALLERKGSNPLE